MPWEAGSKGAVRAWVSRRPRAPVRVFGNGISLLDQISKAWRGKSLGWYGSQELVLWVASKDCGGFRVTAAPSFSRDFKDVQALARKQRAMRG